ncbi:MAG: TetR/AcrR family transcriptional regulator [Chloroflexota bacterium]|nr:TetR/AcrR family transcriptional regulator [Chloroflexota bacterium]
MPAKKGLTKSEQRETTIQSLTTIARDVFAQMGYAQASIDEIVQRAGVTKGALYHHFDNKEGLFRAVLADVQRDVTARIEAASVQEADAWQQLIAGCRAFLAASLDPQVQQIMLIDAPAVLGWQTWRQIDTENSMKSLRWQLGEMVQAGIIQPPSVEALTHLLSGAMNEAALWIVRAPQPEQALEDAMATLEGLMSALRNP